MHSRLARPPGTSRPKAVTPVAALGPDAPTQAVRPGRAFNGRPGLCAGAGPRMGGSRPGAVSDRVLQSHRLNAPTAAPPEQLKGDPMVFLGRRCTAQEIAAAQGNPRAKRGGSRGGMAGSAPDLSPARKPPPHMGPPCPVRRTE